MTTGAIKLRNGTIMFPIHKTRMGGGYRVLKDNVVRFPVKASAKVVVLPIRRKEASTP